MKIRGLRIDPAQLPAFFESADEAADGVVQDAVDVHADFMFVKAFDPSTGAYYPARSVGAWVDPVWGAQGFLPKLLYKASQANVKVVASFVLNRFDNLAKLHPDMRVKTVRMTNYEPPMLSAYASGFRTFLKTILDDCATSMPELAGLEAYKTSVALRLETHRDEMPDHHREATRLFTQKWPKEQIPSMKWRDYRATGISNLHKTLFESSRLLSAGKNFVCQELPTITTCDARLASFVEFGRLSGFAWERIQVTGLDVAVFDVSWQRQEAGCGWSVFSPKWVSDAVAQFTAQLDPLGATQVIAQVEATSYQSVSGGVIAPTPDQFQEALAAGYTASGGAIAHGYSQLRSLNLLPAVQSVFGAT